MLNDSFFVLYDVYLTYMLRLSDLNDAYLNYIIKDHSVISISLFKYSVF